MDIIEANECLRSWFGPPNKSAFDKEKEEAVIEGVDGAGGVEIAAVGTEEEPIITDYNHKDYARGDEVLERYDNDVEEVTIDGEEQEDAV